MPAPHPPEFRRRAVELARLGEKPVAAIAKDLRISESCLRNWMAQDGTDNSTGTGGGSSSRLIFPLVRELADDGFNVAVTCRVLGVRRQAFYEWRSGVKSARAQENELLLKHIERVHAESRGTYGWPRVHAELTLGLGMSVNHKRVAG